MKSNVYVGLQFNEQGIDKAIWSFTEIPKDIGYGIFQFPIANVHTEGDRAVGIYTNMPKELREGQDVYIISYYTEPRFSHVISKVFIDYEDVSTVVGELLANNKNAKIQICTVPAYKADENVPNVGES